MDLWCDCQHFIFTRYYLTRKVSLFHYNLFKAGSLVPWFLITVNSFEVRTRILPSLFTLSILLLNFWKAWTKDMGSKACYWSFSERLLWRSVFEILSFFSLIMEAVQKKIKTWATSMKNTIVFSSETNCKPSVPTLDFLPVIRLCCCTVWSFQNSQSQQEKSHFISKENFSSNPAPKISLHQSFLSISGTSLCNLSQYLFHTYESTQMANYASDGTELLCLIRDGSKILRQEKEVWFYQTCGLGEGSCFSSYLYR